MAVMTELAERHIDTYEAVGADDAHETTAAAAAAAAATAASSTAAVAAVARLAEGGPEAEDHDGLDDWVDELAHAQVGPCRCRCRFNPC